MSQYIVYLVVLVFQGAGLFVGNGRNPESYQLGNDAGCPADRGPKIMAHADKPRTCLENSSKQNRSLRTAIL